MDALEGCAGAAIVERANGDRLAAFEGGRVSKYRQLLIYLGGE